MSIYFNQFRQFLAKYGYTEADIDQLVNFCKVVEFSKGEIIIKGGYIAWAQMGDANASIPTPQPVKMRPMFSANGIAASKSSFMFVSKSSIEKNISTNKCINIIIFNNSLFIYIYYYI